MILNWAKHIRCVVIALGLLGWCDRAAADGFYIEGDAWPYYPNGPAGDGFVTFLDWQTIAFIAAGLQTPISALQFSSADCAPHETHGDGAITTIDVIQAFRYSVGLGNPRTSDLGPTNAVDKQPLLGGPRTIFISNSNLVRGREQTINVCLSGDGAECAVGFSLDFDSSQLRLVAPTNRGVPEASSPQPPGQQVCVNPSNAANGHLSVIVIGGLSGNLGPVLVNLTFQTLGSNSTAIHFSDYPTVREVSDTNAVALPATYQDAMIHFISVPQLVNATIVSNEFQCTVCGTNGQPVNIETSTDLQSWNVTSTLTLTNDFQPFSETIGDGAKYYRAVTGP
jgi:hypothetical protein